MDREKRMEMLGRFKVARIRRAIARKYGLLS
jgi:hypothetical protein